MKQHMAAAFVREWPSEGVTNENVEIDQTHYVETRLDGGEGNKKAEQQPRRVGIWTVPGLAAKTQ